MPPSNLSVAEEIYRGVASLLHLLWKWIKGPGMHKAAIVAATVMRQLRRNMTPRRLLSFPHLLVFFWMLLLFWGERWIFTNHVGVCDWKSWEKWVSRASCPLRIAEKGQWLTDAGQKHSPKVQPPITLSSSPIRKSSTLTPTRTGHGWCWPLS